MNRTASLAFAASLVCTDLTGQSTADEILEAVHAQLAPTDRAFEGTIRGTATYSWITSGSVTRMAEGRFEEVYASDGRVRQTMTLPGVGRFARGTDGKTTWELDPIAGTSVPSGDARGATLRLMALMRCASWRELYSGVEPGDRNRTFEMKPESGKADIWTIDQDSMPRRVRLSRTDPFGHEQKITLEYSDWRPVAERKLAFERTLTFAHSRIQLVTTAVDAKAKPAKDTFAIPEAVEDYLAKLTDAGDEPTPRTPEIRIEDFPGAHVASIRKTIEAADLARELGIMLPEISFYIARIGAEMTAAPCTRYHTFEGERIDIEVAIPVAEKIEGKGRIKPSRLPAGKVVTTWHIGPYTELTETYARVQKWAEANDIELGSGWEYYWTDPGLEPDPRNWRTQIFWPLD